MVSHPNDLKFKAKMCMRLARPHAIIVAAFYLVITNLISQTDARITGTGINLDTLYRTGDIWASFVTDIGHLPPTAIVLSLALRAISMVIAFGYVIYTLEASRSRECNMLTLFDGFGCWLKAIVLTIVRTAIVLFGSFLFLIPGIVAAYSFSQAFFLLADHPEWSIFQCLKESRQIMRGHKMQRLLLDFSFFGWMLLTAVPFVSFFANPYVSPYMSISQAHFYNEICGYSQDTEESSEMSEN